METEYVPWVKKIAVLRALVLGDLIFSLPAFEALHAAYSQAKIYLFSRPWVADFLKGRAVGISRIETFRAAPDNYEDLGFIIHPQDAQGFFPRMRAEHFDIAISMQGGGLNSNPFIHRLSPQISVGAREEGTIAPDRWFPHDYYQHDVIRCLDLARLAGAPPLGWKPQLPVLETDAAEAALWLKEIRRPYAVIHPGARDVRRCWPAERFAAVADALKRKHGFEVVLTGSAEDAYRADLVAQHMQETPVNLGGALSLPALVGVLAGAELIVSNDTGVLHLGLAVGTRAVGLFWDEYASKSMPLSRDHFYPLIAWERRCPLCGLFLDREEVVETGPRPCLHQVTFLGEITQAQVMEGIERVLAEKDATRPATLPALPL